MYKIKLILVKTTLIISEFIVFEYSFGALYNTSDLLFRFIDSTDFKS